METGDGLQILPEIKTALSMVKNKKGAGVRSLSEPTDYLCVYIASPIPFSASACFSMPKLLRT